MPPIMPLHFYPRSPCGERRCAAQAHGGAQWNFYPRSPCGERHPGLRAAHSATRISIHALLAESDSRPAGPQEEINIFLSTLSLRRATSRGLRFPPLGMYFYPRSPCGERQAAVRAVQQIQGISIHALLAESDHWTPTETQFPMDFYPRSPCGERRVRAGATATNMAFLSTLSLRRATPCVCQLVNAIADFYPRSPCGERLLVDYC